MTFKKNNMHGYLLSVAGFLFAAVYFIPYSKAVESVSPEVFTMGLFLISFSIQAVIQVCKRKNIIFSRKLIFHGALFALFSVVGNISCGIALEDLSSPVVVVILRTQVVFLMLVGWLFFSEKVNRYLWAGGGLSIIGIFISNYSRSGFQVDKWTGIMWVLLAMVCFAATHIIVKISVRTENPESLNLVRNFLSALMIGLIPGRAVALISLTPFEWTLITISALFGPILSRTLNMYALKMIPVSLFILFSMLTPVFALVLSWIFLNDVPSGIEMTGGFIVLCGVSIPLIANMIKR